MYLSSRLEDEQKSCTKFGYLFFSNSLSVFSATCPGAITWELITGRTIVCGYRGRALVSNSPSLMPATVVTSHQELHEMEYSLGLLLAEKKEYDEAVVYLKRAARDMPDQARIHYNLGLLLQHLKRDLEAEVALTKAMTLEPDNINYLYALTEYYLKREKFQEAKPIAQQMVDRHPGMQIGRNLLKVINRELDQTN